MTSMSASTKDGQALISVSNLDLDAEAHLQLDLRGLAVAEVSGRLLTADEPQRHNTDQDAYGGGAGAAGGDPGRRGRVHGAAPAFVRHADGPDRALSLSKGRGLRSVISRAGLGRSRGR